MANARAGSSQHVLVSFSAAPSVVSTPKWQHLQAALRAQLPLRNIHWRPASNTAIRTIQELEVDLVPLDTPRDEHTQIPVTLLEKPLLNIYVVNTDLEGYRTTVKKQIKDWHSDVTARKNQEWLIVHIINPKVQTATTNFFKGTVLEKIRADFNIEKRERCVQVAWAPETDAPAVWAELINKIKDGILKLANTISVFDFRIYLLSRQCELLARRGYISDISRKAAAFLGAFGRRLRDVEATLPQFFIESWIYSSALSVVEYCDNWASGFSISDSKLNSFNAAKGELLDLARTQLDVIGVTVGHLPQSSQFSSSCKSTSPGKRTSTLTITNDELLEAINDVEAFYKLYIDATNRAIEMYTKAGRKKFALRLHGSLAALDLHRGKYKSALALYMSLPAHYAPHMWTSLEACMLSKALDTHAHFEQKKDMEWIHIVLSYLKSYIDNLGSELLMHEQDKMEYISRLVESLHQAAVKLDADLAHPNHPAVKLQSSPNARIAETMDGCFLDVTVQNQLPCAVAAGTYVLDSSELRVAKLCLQYQHRKPPSKTPAIRKELPLLVHVPRDLLALDVTISPPDKIELGQSPMLLVAVSTGRNHIVKAIVRLTSSGVIFYPKDAFYSGNKSSEPLEVVDNAVVLEDIPKHTVVTFMIPHSDTSAFQAMKIVSEVDYTTVPEPSLSRTTRATHVVITALPISANVQDFFRGSRNFGRLFSKFTISTTGHQHVRIRDAHLMTQDGGLDGVKISPTATKNRDVVTVTSVQSANFLFHIDSAHGPVRESLTLLIRYRLLRQEVESIVEETVDQVLADSPSPHQHRTILINSIVKALENDAGWVDLYGITGEIRVPDSEDELDEETAKLFKKAIEVLKEHKHPYPPEGNWREINFPVEVPFMNIVASANVRIVSTPFSEVSPRPGTMPLYAGQPISATISIHTSFHWGSSVGEKQPRYMLRYDVEEMARDWLVSGPKRGDFAAADGETNVVSLTLVALHHGELALPKVFITALPMAGELTMGSMAVPSIETSQTHGAETVLVLPRGGRSTFIVSMGSN
ncbi:hypothetical protein C0991_000914 [Blastosporella zonata]|nr:hypothetical protein C0991_000914 [Blastosporella zonata]